MRVQRIYGHLIFENRAFLKGKSVQLILLNGKTMFGEILEIEEKSLLLQDKAAYWYNRKLHQFSFEFAEIGEVIV
ncbi:MAG: hypothetical protein ACKVTZ_14180 [Bacteroidia bacterium]